MDLSPQEVDQLPFCLNELLRPSRKRNGYHTFTLLFRVKFRELESSAQALCLRNEGIWKEQQPQEKEHHHREVVVVGDDDDSITSIVTSPSPSILLIHSNECICKLRGDLIVGKRILEENESR